MQLHTRHVASVLSLVLILGSQTVCATTLTLHGKKAKHLYNTLTGSQVQQQGAAGHLYRQGKSILCRYTDVDISNHGVAVPMNAPSRYACSMKFNHNGLASPGPNP